MNHPGRAGRLARWWMSHRWTLLRRLAQTATVLLLISPLAGLGFFVGNLVSSCLVGIALTDPFAGMEVLLASRGVAAGVLGSVLVVVAAYLLLGRAFCAWLCPLGAVLEGVDWLRERGLRPLLGRLRRSGRLRGRWGRLPDWQPPRAVRFALAGLLLLAGMVAGLPLFELISPQATLMRALAFGAGLQLWLVALVALFDLLVARRGWCRHLCPAGAAYSLISRTGLLRVRLDPGRCTGCRECLSACPMGEATLRPAVTGRVEARADALTCTACGACIEICSRRALGFTWQVPWLGARPAPGAAHASPDPAAPAGPGTGARAAPGSGAPGVLPRRQWLRGAIGAAGAAALALVWQAEPALARVERSRLRPPGARAEGEFLAQCLRCGKCAQVCPRGAVRMAGLEAGLMEVGTPCLEPRVMACDLCQGASPPPCAGACATGALLPVASGEVRMGEARIDHDRCFARSGVICRACYTACPRQDQSLLLIRQHELGVWVPEVVTEKCSGCGLCEQVCPQDPPAIQVRPLNPPDA